MAEEKQPIRCSRAMGASVSGWSYSLIHPWVGWARGTLRTLATGHSTWKGAPCTWQPRLKRPDPDVRSAPRGQVKSQKKKEKKKLKEWLEHCYSDPSPGLFRAVLQKKLRRVPRIRTHSGPRSKGWYTCAAMGMVRCAPRAKWRTKQIDLIRVSRERELPFVRVDGERARRWWWHAEESEIYFRGKGTHYGMGPGEIKRKACQRVLLYSVKDRERESCFRHSKQFVGAA